MNGAIFYHLAVITWTARPEMDKKTLHSKTSVLVAVRGGFIIISTRLVLLISVRHVTQTKHSWLKIAQRFGNVGVRNLTSTETALKSMDLSSLTR